MSERFVASTSSNLSNNNKLDERTAAALRHGRSSPLQRQRPPSKHNKDGGGGGGGGGGGIPSSPLKGGEPLSEMSQTDSASSSTSSSSSSTSSSIDLANEAHSSKSSSHKKEKKSGSSGSKKRDKKERAKEREEHERFLRQQQELRRKLKSEIETLPQHRRTSLSGGDANDSSNHSNAKTRRSPSSSPPASFLGGLGSLSSSSENTPTSLLLSPTSPSSSPSTTSTKTTPTSSSTNTESLSGCFSGGESGTEGEGSSPSSFSSSASSHSMSGEERGGKGERESRALQTKKTMTEVDWDRKLANLSDITVRELLAELLGKLSALEEPFAEELVRTTRRKIALKWVGNDQSSKLRRVSVDVSNYSASSSCPSSGSSSAPSSSLSSSTSAAYLSASCSGEVSLLPAPREQGWHASSMHKTVPVSMVQTRSNSSQSLFSGRSTIATSSTSHNDKDKDNRDSFSGTSSLSANTTSTREQRRSFTGDGLPSGRDHHSNDGNEASERESSSVSFSVEQHSSSKKEKKSERKSRAPSLTSDDPRANVKATGIDSVSPRKPNKDESKKKRRKSMKFGGGVSLKDSGNFRDGLPGSSSGSSSGSGFSSRKESSKAGKGLFSRLFSGSVNDRVAELILKEEEEWRLNWPELAALPEEVLVSVHLCSYEQTKGVLYLSTTNICFGERQSGTNESFIFKKRLPLPTLVFVRKTGKGAITVLTHDTKAVLSQFESKQRDLAYETINKLFAPFLPMAQSLHPAILRKDIHTLNLILTSEVAQEKLEELNEDGEPPLASAIRSNDLRITKMMLQYCKQAKMDINFKDRYGYTALHTACLMNVKDEIIEALLNFEHIQVTVVNQDGNTPLHYFCKCFLSPSCQDLAQMMINLGADVNFQNESGETALHKAILNDCVRVLLIDCLIENGADVNIVTERGEAPLHYAVRLGRKDVVSQLLCAGADTELVGNLEMKTPLALAQEAQYHEIASHLSRVHDLLSWLKTIGVPELLTFFIQSEIFLDDLLKMSTKKFDRLLDEIEGNYGYEIGENKVRKSDIKNSWQLLKKMEDEKVSKEEVLEMAETLSGKDKQAIIGSLSKIIEESRNKRMTRTSDAAALEAVRKAMAEQAAQEAADSADEEEGDDWIMTHSQLEFTKKLGTGASGKVYRGLYKRKDVAIKVLYERGDREEENDPIQELMEEIKVMSNFGESAQEIVRFYGVCLEPAVCLVMEYCERGSLHQVLRDPHLDLSWQMVLSFAKQTARGLELLHGSTPPIFHRDLKTGNLLVTADWRIKVADFGLSRSNTQDNRSALGKLCGTICYCAPELFYGKGFTVSADIFSLGIVFWELVQRSMSGTYKKPYEEYNFSLDVQILVQAAEHGLRPTLPANLPEAVQHLIQRCWSPTVAQRPSAGEIVRELEKLEEQYAADPQAWEKTRVVTSSMTTTMTTGGDASTSSSPPSSSDAARAAVSAASSSSSS